MLPQPILLEINSMKDCQGQHGHSFHSVVFFFSFSSFAESAPSALRLLFLSNLQSSEQSINQAAQSGQEAFWTLVSLTYPGAGRPAIHCTDVFALDSGFGLLENTLRKLC